MTAVGDVVSGIITLGSSTKILPPSGEEWVIHNIIFTDKVRLYFYDVVNDNNLEFYDSTGADRLEGFNFHCTEAYCLRIARGSGVSSELVTYDGVVTKVAA